MKELVYDYTCGYGMQKLAPYACKYSSNERLAIELITQDGEPWSTLTVNLPGTSDLLDDDCAYIDTNNCSGAIDYIKKNKLGEVLPIVGYSGYCTYPCVKFDLSKLNKMPE